MTVNVSLNRPGTVISQRISLMLNTQIPVRQFSQPLIYIFQYAVDKIQPALQVLQSYIYFHIFSLIPSKE